MDLNAFNQQTNSMSRVASKPSECDKDKQVWSMNINQLKENCKKLMTKLLIGKLQSYSCLKVLKISRWITEWPSADAGWIPLLGGSLKIWGQDNQSILCFPRHSVSPFAHLRHGRCSAGHQCVANWPVTEVWVSAAWRWRNCNFIIRPSSAPGNKYVRL